MQPVSGLFVVFIKTNKQKANEKPKKTQICFICYPRCCLSEERHPLTVVTSALSRVSPRTALVSACTLLHSLCVIISLSLAP